MPRAISESESGRRTGTVACRSGGTVTGVRFGVMVTGIVAVTDGHCGHKSDGMLTVLAVTWVLGRPRPLPVTVRSWCDLCLHAP